MDQCAQSSGGALRIQVVNQIDNLLAAPVFKKTIFRYVKLVVESRFSQQTAGKRPVGDFASGGIAHAKAVRRKVPAVLAESVNVKSENIRLLFEKREKQIGSRILRTSRDENHGDAV